VPKNVLIKVVYGLSSNWQISHKMWIKPTRGGSSSPDTVV